ncbi:MAG: SLBB domain-containing protein [Acidobacteria bacterium]|nr:SLBB domain-containing protein [Acidobacteriota bacterium]
MKVIGLATAALLVFWGTSRGSAQEQYPGYDTGINGYQSQSSADCSDPAFAASPGCSRQSTGQNASQTGQGQQNQTGILGQLNQNPQNFSRPDRNYFDLDQYGRQPNRPYRINQPPPPPEHLTEFQKFIASSTGQVLPIYGSNLFRDVPSTFAPIDMAPVPSDFVIGPGDELRIRVWGQLSFQANVRVDRSGEIYLPQVGPIHVASVPFSDLDKQLRDAIGRVYKNFDLTVDLGRIRSIQVYLSGEARTPGLYTVSSLSSLVDALFAAGGPRASGSLRRIEVRRNGEKVSEFDLYALLIHGDKSKDVKLQPGDVIYIPPTGGQVAITGSVRVPAIYELLPGESVSDLVADAGGVSAVASQARLSIERIEEHNNRHAMEVAFDQTGLATVLADGDLVRVFSIVPQYKKTVILRGNVANPGRFAWHPGMRVSELIPDKDSLVTRNYWWKRTQLGLPAPEFEPTANFRLLRQPKENEPLTLRQGNSGAVDQQGTQDQTSAEQASSHQSRTSQDQALLAGAQDQSSSAAAQTRGANSSLAAQGEIASRRDLANQVQQKTTVSILAPDIDWNYAVVERVDPETLKTTLIPFDLGKLVLQHDSSHDLELQSGDVVSIFSEADIRVPTEQQTKFVTLDGEFVHAGIYSVRSGETLRDVVSRAGGISSKAYLYGSEFTRESVQKAQQARIDEYARTLESSIQRSNLALVAAASTSPESAVSSSAAQATEKDLLASVRQIKATGRIVLEFKPGNQDMASIPAIDLENGDHFVIPPIPAVINVVGAVYNQNSFLYRPSQRVEGYLMQAGGPNRNADKRHAFIIRANGSVESRDRSGSIWTSDKFSQLHLNPGDTIVVPDKTYKPSLLRGFLDWSQLFSQLAFGAAAINVLR